MDTAKINEFDGTEDLAFAICILNKRRRDLLNNFPLVMKIVSSIRTIVDIKTSIEETENVTDLSDCDDDVKAQILENAKKLDERQKHTIQEADANTDMQCKHGRWVDEYDGLPFCSVCDYNGYGHIMSPYCPNCGAKMDLEVKNDKD